MVPPEETELTALVKVVGDDGFVPALLSEPLGETYNTDCAVILPETIRHRNSSNEIVFINSRASRSFI